MVTSGLAVTFSRAMTRLHGTGRSGGDCSRRSILVAAPRIGAYAASAWLLVVAINLGVAGYFDVAVRDIVMSIAAFGLARYIEIRDSDAVRSRETVGGSPLTVTA